MITSSASEKSHSTTLALIDLHEKISSAIDRGELAVGVFLYLSRVNHSILLDKLEHRGIRGLDLKWISNRLQFVEYNDYVSSRAYIMFGIPQGSILGSLFFCSTSTIISTRQQYYNWYYLRKIQTFFCLTRIMTAWLIYWTLS